jgi:putative Ig domain-containing protein
MKQRVLQSALLALFIAACSGEGRITEPTVPVSPTALSATGSDPVTGATIETNKDDYMPGEAVHLVGHGWAPNETVQLYMTEDPDTHGDVSQDLQVDSAGAFSIHFYDVQQHDAGVTFTLTATGATSGSVATAVFTDQIPITSVTLNGGSSVTVAPNAAINASVSGVVNNGAGLTTLGSISVKTYLDGANASTAVLRACFDVSPDITHSGSGSTPYTQVLPFPAPPTVGLYDVLVQSYVTSNCTTPIQSFTLQNGVTVQLTNTPPVLTSVGDQGVDELTALAFTATATDENVATLAYSLANPATGTFPLGATISGAGAFSWTPTEAQGPGVYRVTIVVTDEGSLTDSEEIQITVNEVNVAPTLDPIGNKTVDELMPLAFTASASDTDLPANTLSFSLANPGSGTYPAGASITLAGAFSWTPTEVQGPGVYRVKIIVSDGSLSAEEEIQITVNEVNVAPVLALIGAKSVDEGSLLSFTATASDADRPPNALTFSLDAGAPAGASIAGSTGVFTWTPMDGPTQSTSITVRVTDNGTPQLSAYETINITVNNVPPSIGSVAALPTISGNIYPISQAVTIAANFSDPGSGDTHTCSTQAVALSVTPVNAGPTAALGTTCSNVLTFTSAGVYDVTITVTDDDGDSDAKTIQVIVYDPSAGFVTGGGWIDSPAGAYSADASLTGKATFGFVAKYVKKLAAVPEGNTQFVFHAGNFNFHSGVYEFLIVNQNGTNAQFKGSGTVNGSGAYTFMLWATDGTYDNLRIKIWETATNTVVYDNGLGAADGYVQAITSGSIVIHTPKK